MGDIIYCYKISLGDLSERVQGRGASITYQTTAMEAKHGPVYVKDIRKKTNKIFIIY